MPGTDCRRGIDPGKGESRMTTIKAVSDRSLSEAVAILRGGGIVAFPTETVYGLGADATDGKAVSKIFEAKKRPEFNPLISHFHSLDHLGEYVDLDDESLKLAMAFWPGPMTLIVPRRAGCRISDLTTSGLDTVAVRIPAHKTARKLIEAAGLPLAAPSANLSGEISPTAAQHVYDSLGDTVSLILADGAAAVGLESTVIDMADGKAVILRPGAVTAEQIADVLGYNVAYDDGTKTDKPKSPGQLLRHYAPRLAVRLRAYDVAPDEALLAFGSVKFMGIKGGGKIADLPAGRVLNLSEKGDLYEAAGNLFSCLRRLDQTGAAGIAVMDIPAQGIGIAINDRLRRAAASGKEE